MTESVATESTATDLDVVGSHSVSADIEALKNGSVAVYSSFKADSFEDRISIVKAMANSKPLDEFLGKTINLRNFIVQSIDMADEKTGEMREAPRVILIDDQGNSYHAISHGIMSALTNVVAVVGEPSTWPQAIAVKPTQEKTRAGFRVFTLRYA